MRYLTAMFLLGNNMSKRYLHKKNKYKPKLNTSRYIELNKSNLNIKKQNAKSML